MLLTLFKVIIFGIVEGITEWLPISSTGHMILLNAWMPLSFDDAFLTVFLIVIQLGAVFAVLCLFWRDICPLEWEGKGMNRKKKPLIRQDKIHLWLKIGIACLPAVMLELLWGDVLEERFYHPAPVAMALIIVGILFIVVEYIRRRKMPVIVMTEDITWQMAFFIGVCQAAAAAFPGTSRSGATIIGALLLGIDRSVAAAFTFYLAIPVMFGASLVKIVECSVVWSMDKIVYTCIGMATAFIVSVMVIGFLMDYVRQHDFKIFGWYRILLGMIVLLYFI